MYCSGVPGAAKGSAYSIQSFHLWCCYEPGTLDAALQLHGDIPPCRGRQIAPGASP